MCHKMITKFTHFTLTENKSLFVIHMTIHSSVENGFRKTESVTDAKTICMLKHEVQRYINKKGEKTP